jgi:hypothetical protein
MHKMPVNSLTKALAKKLFKAFKKVIYLTNIKAKITAMQKKEK